MNAFEKRTELFRRNLKAKTRYVINQGGTGSSKTYSLLLLMFIIAVKNQGCIISCVSESLPHCKRGMIRDFKKILIENNAWEPDSYNKSDQIYQVGKSQIEFFGVDSDGKVHGARRDYLFVNEIQNIPYEIFHQLASRTNIRIYCDYNPTSEFWVHEKYLNNSDWKDQITYIHSTYKDNPYLPESVVNDILTRAKKDENYRRVYIEGLPGRLEGLVFNNVTIIDEFPEINYYYGLDFGYTNDPTALVKVGRKNDNIYIDELLYTKGFTNTDIARFIIEKGYNQSLIYADSAEPKSIDEIGVYGVNVIGADKGKDSVINGIQFLQQFNLNVTKRSVNTIKEFRNYSWHVDKSDRVLNKPIDMFNHSMDAIRYAATMAYSNIHNNEWIIV